MKDSARASLTLDILGSGGRGALDAAPEAGADDGRKGK